MGKVLVSYERESPFPDWVTSAVLKTMHQVDGKTLEQIAVEFNTSKQNVYNWIKRASPKNGDNSKGG